MDDTIAMQDTNVFLVDLSGPVSSNDAGSTGDNLTSVVLKLQSASQPCTPQHQQGGGGADASSVASDSSSQEQSRSVRLPAGTGHADVDAAKQAALSALAGLDMTTTKANLDASKAAAATARANGEIPTHPRKSNLRSVSCRQLGSGSSSSATTSSTPIAGKTVGFDDTAKNRGTADASRPAQGQWRDPTTFTADGQPQRANRPPASRCISLPAHVLQSRVGMANRLAASYAPDAAALQQQQFQLLNGAAGLQNYNFQQQLHQATLGHPADTLTVYQMQHHGLTGPPPSALLSHRSFGAPGLAADDSVLPVQSGGNMLQQQQQQFQQQQLQQARMAQGSWVPAAAGAQTGLTRWGSGQLAQPNAAALAQAQAVNANAQLLAQLQVTSQAQQGGDALWMGAPASAGLQLSSNPQGMMLQPQTAVSGATRMSGIPGLQQQQLLAQLQPAGATSMATASPSSGGGAISASALLESYQSVSWSVLAAAQGEGALRDQLLTELVLLLTMLHTLNNTLKGSITPADALNDLTYLAGAARRHMATFNRLSQAGNIALQLLALITPFALRHVNSAELIEAAFLVLDTLALANRDVANVVAQQRLTALAAVGMQLPVEQLLQQQQVGLAWIANLAGAVSRNKAMLESMGGDGSSQGGATGGSAGLVQNANMSGGLVSASLGVPASHAMLLGQQAGVSLPNTTLSPTRKTPLATYFEEAAQGTAAAGTAGAAAASGLAGLGGTAVAPPGMRVGAGTPPGTRLGDALLTDALGGVNIVAAPPGIGQDVGQVAQDAAAAGQLGISDLEQLAGLSLGIGSAVAQAGTGVGQHAAAPGSTGTYSPLGGGLSLFGESPLLVPGGGIGSSGPSSTGATNTVGV